MSVNIIVMTPPVRGIYLLEHLGVNLGKKFFQTGEGKRRALRHGIGLFQVGNRIQKALWKVAKA